MKNTQSPICNPEVLTAVSLVCNKLSSNRNCSPIVWNQLCFSFMCIVFIWDPKVRPRNLINNLEGLCNSDLRTLHPNQP